MNIRREQLREATARHRKRAKRRFLWRPILVTEHQLDQLEVRGYLDPNRGGDRLDEIDAIEAYLADSFKRSLIIASASLGLRSKSATPERAGQSDGTLLPYSPNARTERSSTE